MDNPYILAAIILIPIVFIVAKKLEAQDRRIDELEDQLHSEDKDDFGDDVYSSNDELPPKNTLEHVPKENHPFLYTLIGNLPVLKFKKVRKRKKSHTH